MFGLVDCSMDVFVRWFALGDGVFLWQNCGDEESQLLVSIAWM
jgi:hypothetical protein